MKQIIDNLKSLGRKRVMILGATGVGIVGALLIGASFAFSPQYRAVATDVTAAEASGMVTALEQAGFAPKVSLDGTVISLPEGDLARARMTLAEAGVPSAGAAGWEIFDNTSGLGMNSFLQRVNRLRAMEGELARSINSIDAVDSARVHLVLPERETFSQDRPEATASIIIKTKRGLPLERRHAIAARNLVAASVPGLAPERVTVLSASGDTILADEQGQNGFGVAATRAAMEDRLARSIESMVAARVGAGNVRVRVAAELATEREVVVTQTYDPDQQVARRTNILAEERQGRNGSPSSADVANNMPGTANGAVGNLSREESQSKTQDTIDYEIGSRRSEKIIEPGAVKRLTVAVVVNGTVVEGTYAPRDQEEINQIIALAQSAVGFDESRGDIVTVESMQFIDNEFLISDEDKLGVSDAIASNMGTIIQGIMALIAMGLILFFGVRPWLRNARGEVDEAEANKRGDAAKALTGNAVSGANVAKNGKTENDVRAQFRGELPATGEEGGDMVDIPTIASEVRRRHIDELERVILSDREKTVAVLRQWIEQKG